MPRLETFNDVRLGSRVAPPVLSLGWQALACAVCLAFAADGASTLLAVAAGGRELNPLVAGLAPLPYALSCLVRAAVACALLRLTASQDRRIRAPTQAACLVLVAVKTVATLSNLAFVYRATLL